MEVVITKSNDNGQGFVEINVYEYSCVALLD